MDTECHVCHLKLPKCSGDYDEEMDRLVDKVKVTVYTPEDGSKPYYRINKFNVNERALIIAGLVVLGVVTSAAVGIATFLTFGLAALIFQPVIGGYIEASIYFVIGKHYCYECFWKLRVEEEEKRRVTEGYDKELIDKKAMHFEYLEWLNESKGYSNPYQQPYKNQTMPSGTSDLSTEKLKIDKHVTKSDYHDTPDSLTVGSALETPDVETTNSQYGNILQNKQYETPQTEQTVDFDPFSSTESLTNQAVTLNGYKAETKQLDIHQHDVHDKDESTRTAVDLEENYWSCDEEYSSYSEDNSDWEESEEEEGEYDPMNDYKQLNGLFDEIIEMNPRPGDIVYDYNWQTDLQLCLLSYYASLHDLNNIEIEELASELASIGSTLNYSELFSLSKALTFVCKGSLTQSLAKSQPLYPDITDQFLYDLTLAASKIRHKGCLEACLGELISHKLNSMLKNALQTMCTCTIIIYPSQTDLTNKKQTTCLWTVEDAMSLLQNEVLACDKETFLQMVQLALINQISFEHFKDTLDASSSSPLDSLMRHVTKNDRSLEQITSDIAKTGLVDSNTLQQAHEIIISLNSELTEDTFLKYKAFRSNDLAALIKKNILNNRENYNLVVGLKFLCCAVKEYSHGKYFPTNAQLVALCILILSHQNKSQLNRLLEVSSGEGKSTIIAMFAAYICIQENKVDIITSSLELAQRDSADWKEFFERFNLSSAHNTETEELLTMRQDQADKERVKIYEEHDIVYGTVSSFSADYLRQNFEMRTIRPKRPYRVAIVDEVDMLMLDEGVQFTYLSHQAPVLRHIEPVLALVWSSVCQNTPLVTSTGDTLFAGVPRLIQNIIFERINRAVCSDQRQLLCVAAQESIIDQDQLDKILTATDTKSQKVAMEIFTTTKMIKLVSSLQEHYLPCRFKVFVFTSSGKIEEETLPEPTTTTREDIERPEFSLLLMDKGFACPIYNQKKLSVAVEKMVSSQCDLPLHNSESSSLKAQDGQKYFEGVTGFFHDIIYTAITRQVKLKFETSEQILDLAVKYNLMLESDVTQLLHAINIQTKESVMKKLTSSQLCAFIEKVNADLPLTIQLFQLNKDGVLVPKQNEETKTSNAKEPRVPVLVQKQGLVCPLYAYEWIAPKSEEHHTKDGNCYWVGKPGFFHEIIFQCLTSEQILYLAVRNNLIGEMDVKQFLQAKDRTSKQRALEKCEENEIQELLNCLQAERNINFSLYMRTKSHENTSLELFAKEKRDLIQTSNDPNLLYKRPGMLCQLHLKQTVQIPEFMKDFVSNQLSTYIQSAFTALSMTEEREYLVTEHRKIAPIDFQNTGVIERNKRWGGGLQQMLEMKHSLELSPITVITNFISHVGFLKLYEALYGLSGTIGLKQEQDILRDDAMYKLHSCCIPTSKKRRFYECREVIVQGSKEDWKNEIYLNLVQVTGKESRRVALVLCEDISTAKEIEQFLDTQKQVKQLTTYYGPENREHVNSHVFESGDIIIATNLAGRGTDIKVSQEVNNCGGLFCLVTFLPRNERVEMQAFGRTARCGNPGSAQLLLLASSLPREYQCLDMKTIRELRAQQETHRLSSMVEHDVQEVMLREELFAKQCEYIHKVRNHFDKDKNVSIIIDSVNEHWGQWLQTKQRLISQTVKGNRESLISDLEQIHLECDSSLQMHTEHTTFDNTIPVLPGGNFIYLIKLGNQLAKSGRQGQTQAIQCYHTAIDIEKQYSPGHQSRHTAIAYYNHAYCEINVYGDQDHKSGDERTQIRSFITKAQALLRTYTEETNVVLQCVKQTRRHNSDHTTLYYSDFATQMEVRLQVIEFVLKKIDESLQELEELAKSGEYRIEAVPSSIFQLIPNPDIVTEEELLGLSQLGLEFVFNVKKKPRFCWEGLVVVILGIAEITVGVCLIVLTEGIGSEIGMGLIAEGVSDCFDGTIGMITGEWSWSQWATMKACSIAVSMVTGGVGKFAELAEIGAKELPKLAAEGANEATKLSLKDAGKIVGKEFVQQGVMRGLGEVENLVLEKIVHIIAEHVTDKSGVRKALETDFSGENPLGLVVNEKFASRLPPGYRNDDTMSPVLEKEAIDFFNELVNSVVASLITQSEMFGQVMTTLSDLIHGISGHFKGKGGSLLHLLELSLVKDSIDRAEFQLDSLFSHFKEDIENYSKDPNQRKHVTDLKEFLAKHTAVAASRALVQEVKVSTVDLIKHPLDEEQDKALNFVMINMGQKATEYLKTGFRKSFFSDQELERIVSIIFVAPHVKKRENVSLARTSSSFREAVRYFETAVHEVMLKSKDTGDFQEIAKSVISFVNKTSEPISPKVLKEYVSKLELMLDSIPSRLYTHCEQYVQSVQTPHNQTKELVRHLTKFNLHKELHSHCQDFFQGSNNITQVTGGDSEEQSRGNVNDLKCIVALKKKLAEQTIETFTDAVASVLLQNLGWIANQALNRTVNGQLAHYVSEPWMTLKSARENAQYVGQVVSSVMSNKMTPCKVEYHGNALFNSTVPLSEAELKVAAELHSLQIELTDRFGHKRTIEPISKDKSTEELQTFHLIEDEKGKYSLADDNEHRKYKLVEALTHGINHSKSLEHHLDQSQLQQAIAQELLNSPNKWIEHYETERMRADLKPHIAEILDPKSSGTKFEVNVEEEIFKVGITIVRKDGKILRKSKWKSGEQITLIHIKDRDHNKGHYDRLVDGEHIRVHSDYGNCHYVAVAEEVNRIGDTPVDKQLNGIAVRRAVAAHIANNPKKWHDHYLMKEKLEQSWFWFRRRRILKGGAKIFKPFTNRRGKCRTSMMRDSQCRSRVVTLPGEHVDHKVELQQFVFVLNHSNMDISEHLFEDLKTLANCEINLQRLKAKKNIEKGKFIRKSLHIRPQEHSLGEKYQKARMIKILKENLQNIQLLVTKVEISEFSETLKLLEILRKITATTEDRLSRVKKMKR